MRPALRFVAHPGAGRNAFRRRWPSVAEALRRRGLRHEVALTEGAGHAADLARRAVDEGARLVVAVGGDGTLHEVANGVLGDGERAPDGVMVGLVPAGRGSDYARGLGFDTAAEALAGRFAAALEGDPSAVRRVDAGEVTYRPSRVSTAVTGRAETGDGRAAGAERAIRRFVNEAGVGFSPLIARRTARFPARFGAWLYTLAGIITIIDWRHRALALTWDSGERQEGRFASVEVALGRYAGGGMLLAPGAEVGDGVFDVITIGEAGRAELLSFSWRLRSGDHLRSPVVAVRRAVSLSVEALDDGGPLYLQADGENLGRDPASFRVLPDALAFVG